MLKSKRITTYQECKGTGCYEARLIAEKVLGKPLPPDADVHHIDENQSNNSYSNLVVCENRAYHKLLHQRTDALRACGHADWRRCSFCKEYDSPQNMEINIRRSYHKRCMVLYNRHYNKLQRAGLGDIFRP